MESGKVIDLGSTSRIGSTPKRNHYWTVTPLHAYQVCLTTVIRVREYTDGQTDT